MKKNSAKYIFSFLIGWVFLCLSSFSFAATQVYRSVGPSATDALDDDNSHADTITVSSGTATFSAAVPDNVGVGDAIVIDTSGDDSLGSNDTVLFISGRTDSTHYSVQTETGGTPSDISANDTWEIYRAYTSLANAESGTTNSSISVSFDSWSGGRDLVTNDEQWNIACYANGTTADTTAGTIDGWTTDSDNYIYIYTPTSTSEVGTSQRHSGKWDETKYRIEVTAGADYTSCISIREDNVKVEGLQLKIINAGYSGCSTIGTTGLDSGNKVEIYKMILRGEETTNGAYGYVNFDSDTNIYMANTIIYDFDLGTGIDTGNGVGASSAYYYDNTIYNCNVGIDAEYADVAKNNLVYNCGTECYHGDFASGSTNNLSSDDTADDDSDMANSIINATVAFISTASENLDLHLSPTDTAAKDEGADLSSDSYLPISTDIDGQSRPNGSAYDIGADEADSESYVSQQTGRWTDPSTWGGTVPGPNDTAVIANGHTVTYDAGNVFQDDFEEGAFSQWSGHNQEGSNTAQVDSTQSFGESYSAKFTYTGNADENENYYYRDLGANQAVTYVRLEVYVDSSGLTDTNETNILELTDTAGTAVRARVSIYNNGGQLEIRGYYDDTTGDQAFSSAQSINTGEWHTVELYYKADASNGAATLWVDNSQIASASIGADNSSYTIRRAYIGQYNGANTKAITYYIDDVAVDNEFRIYPRPTTTASNKPNALDYNIAGITINDGGQLSTGSVINSDYSYKYRLWVYGPIQVDGTLGQNAKSEVRIKNDTNVEYGIEVSSAGKLDIEGTSKAEQDAVITAVTQDGSHNGYIYCGNDSECYIRYADISYLGADESNKWGITVNGVNPEDGAEGFYIIGSEISNGYMGVVFWRQVKHGILYDNTFHDFSSVTIIWMEGSDSTESNQPNHLLIAENVFYKPLTTGGSGGVFFIYHANNILFSRNKIFVKDYVLLNSVHLKDSIFLDNVFFDSRYPALSGKFINVQFLGNTIINSGGAGMRLTSSSSNVTIKNNIIGYLRDNGDYNSTNYGIYIDDNGIGLTSDYNLFYGLDNTGYWGTDGAQADLATWQSTTSQDAHSVESAPNFYNFDNSPGGSDTGGSERSVATGATSNTLPASSPGWTEGQWAGYVVWVDDDFSTPEGSQFRYILSNTADTLTIAGSWSTTPDNTYEFKIINFEVGADSPALGAGCQTTDGAASSITNIGAITDLTISTTDSNKKYNSMQLAHDNDSTGAGDTLTTYANDLLTNHINGSVTSVGNGLYYFVIDNDITTDDIYNGYYLYITAGADRGKYYLIVDTDAANDRLYIFDPDLSATLQDNDGFTIVDRVYDRKGAYSGGYAETGWAHLYISKDGAEDNPIIWNTNGNVIVDKKNLSWGIYDNGGQYNNITGFIFTDTNEGKAIGISYQAEYCKIYDNELNSCQIYINQNYAVIENNYIWLREATGTYWYGDTINNPAVCLNAGNGWGNYCVIDNNKLFSRTARVNDAAPIRLWGNNVGNTIVNNFVSGGVRSVSITGTNPQYSTVRGNTLLRGYDTGVAVWHGAHNFILNNTIVKTGVENTSAEGDGISMADNYNIAENNLIYEMRDAGINDGGSTNTRAYNFFYNNGEDIDGGGAIGTGSITGNNPNFKENYSGDVEAGCSDLVLYDADASWTDNQWVGYGVKITIGGTDYWAGITSNTADRLYLAPELSATPSEGDSFIITDFSITGGIADPTTTSPLGQGCRADGTTEPGTVNMGAILDFVKNTTDNEIFNSMQDAHDDADLSAGDTVTTYAVNEVENATIGSAITDLGPMVQLDMASEDTITEDGQYEGMYLYIEAGQNRGKYYLIADSQENTTADDGTDTDTITIVSDDNGDTFHERDVFTIVDRVYTRAGYKGYWGIDILNATKDGDVSNPITWNVAGRVILDGKEQMDHGIFLYSAQYNIVDGFVIIGQKNVTTDNGNPHARCIWAWGNGDYIKNCFLSPAESNSITFNNSYNIAENNICLGTVTFDGEYSIVRDNVVYSTSGGGIISIYNNGTNVIKGNRIFNAYRSSNWWACAMRIGGSDNNTIIDNILFKNVGVVGLAITNGSDNNTVQNNVFLDNHAQTGDINGGIGITDPCTGNHIINNIIVGEVNGIDDNSSGINTHNFNFFYNNTEDIDGGGSIGSHSITGTDPGFATIDSGTADADSTTAMIVDTSKSWTPNQWVGYGVKVTISGTDYWAGITSNTAHRLYLAPALDSAPNSGSDTYVITDFSIAPTTSDTTPLGQGCTVDGSSESGDINMGSHLEFAQLNSSTKYNSLKEAMSAASAGFNIRVGSYVYVENGTISSATDLGPMVQLSVSDVVFSDNLYDGLYLVIKTGANKNKAYLIVDSQDDTTDTIIILCDDAAGFANGDRFYVVDRIYNDGQTDHAVDITKGGDSSSVAMISPYDSDMYWFAGSEDYDDLIDYGIYDSVSGGCNCLQLRHLVPVNYTTATGGANTPVWANESYYYTCSACYTDLLMRLRNYFRREGELIKCGIHED